MYSITWNFSSLPPSFPSEKMLSSATFLLFSSLDIVWVFCSVISERLSSILWLLEISSALGNSLLRFLENLTVFIAVFFPQPPHLFLPPRLQFFWGLSQRKNFRTRFFYRCLDKKDHSCETPNKKGSTEFAQTGDPKEIQRKIWDLRMWIGWYVPN